MSTLSEAVKCDKSDLESVLRESLQLLLHQTRKLHVRNHVENETTVSPLITENEYVEMLKTDPEKANNKNPPEFRYSHKFNALIFLANKIAFLHPQRVVERRRRKENAFAQLTRSALHASAQITNLHILRKLVRIKCAGLAINFIVSTSASTACMSVSSFGPGVSHIEYSEDPYFAIVRCVSSVHSDSFPMRIVLDDLKSDTKYYVRAYFNREDSNDTTSAYMLERSFVTPLSESASSVLVASRWLLPALHEFLTLLADEAAQVGQVCLLGALSTDVTPEAPVDSYMSQHGALLASHTMCVGLHDLGRLVAMDLAWNDNTPWSQASIKEDERLEKKHSRDQKKLKKMARGLSDSLISYPQLPPALESVQLLLPVGVNQGGRQLYHSRVSGSMEVLVLDARNGYLGKKQCEWLHERLLLSKAKWRIVMSGLPLCAHAAEKKTRHSEHMVGTSGDVVEEEADERDETSPRRVQIAVSDETDEQTDKCSLLSALSSFEQYYYEHVFDEVELTVSAGAKDECRVRGALVVLSAGKVRQSAVDVPPYVATFSTSAAGQSDSVPFGVEVYCGSDEMKSLAGECDLEYVSEICARTLWQHSCDPSEERPDLVVRNATTFAVENDVLTLKVLRVCEPVAQSEEELAHGVDRMRHLSVVCTHSFAVA